MSKDKILSTVESLSSPCMKLRVLLSHGLHDEATALLMVLTKTHIPVFFNTNMRRPSVDVGPVSDKDDLRLMVGFLEPDTDMNTTAFMYEAMVLAADFMLLSEALNWDPSIHAAFADNVLARLPEFPANKSALWVVEGTQRVVRSLSPESDNSEIVRRVELWMLHFRVREGRIFELRTKALPQLCPQGHGGAGPQNPRLIESELDPIVSRLLKLGESGKNIRAALKELFVDRIAKGSWQDVLAVASTLRGLGEPKKQIEQGVRAYMERRRDNAWNTAGRYVALRGLYEWTDDDEKILIHMLAEQLARGRAGSVQTWFCDFGGRLLNAKPGGCREDVKPLVALLAFEKARQEDRFGIAAAIALHFGLDFEHQDLVSKALILGQLVVLNWEEAIRPSDSPFPPN